MFIEVPLFYETFPFLKNFWLCACNSDKLIALRKSCAFISMKTNSKLNVALFLKVDYLVSFFYKLSSNSLLLFYLKKNLLFLWRILRFDLWNIMTLWFFVWTLLKALPILLKVWLKVLPTILNYHFYKCFILKELVEGTSLFIFYF